MRESAHPNPTCPEPYGRRLIGVLQTDAMIRRMVGDGITLREAMPMFRRAYIAVAEKRTGGNKTKAAALLGVHRNTMYR